MTTSATSGRLRPQCFAIYDPDGRCWRTSQGSLLRPTGTSDRYSETWPRSGTMRSGVCLERTMLVPHTKGSDCGSWPTPRVASVRTSRGSLTKDGHWSAVGLEQMVELKSGVIPREFHSEEELTPQARRVYEEAKRMWPTPTSTEWMGGGSTKGRNCGDKRGLRLRDHVMIESHGGTRIPRKWATPRAEDAECAGAHRGKADSVYSQVKKQTGRAGQLNPAWVEWLMGWPEGASDWLPVETARFRRWLRLHGLCCEDDSIDTHRKL